MNTSEPGLVFIGLVLPGLFALTMIVEGMWKLNQKTSGWFNILMGLGVMALTFWVYFGLLQTALK